MARYCMHVRTDLAPEDAFAFMADLRNFAEWDPGVERVEQVEGDGAGAGATFDVTLASVGPPITLRYETVGYDPPRTVVATAENRVVRSNDTITVEADGEGAIVTYDAVLELKGPLGLGDPLLGVTFDQIGDRAAAGLVEALAGERIPEAAS